MIYTVLQPFNLNLDDDNDYSVLSKIIDLISIQQILKERISIKLNVELNSDYTLDLTSKLINELNNKLNDQSNEELKKKLNENMKNILDFNFLILKKY